MSRINPLILCLFLVFAAPSAALAQGQGEGDSAGELARQGVEKLMRALEALIYEIPLYEMPELTENGDIIIRRKRKPEDAPPPEPKLDQTDL